MGERDTTVHVHVECNKDACVLLLKSTSHLAHTNRKWDKDRRMSPDIMAVRQLLRDEKVRHLLPHHLPLSQTPYCAHCVFIRCGKWCSHIWTVTRATNTAQSREDLILSSSPGDSCVWISNNLMQSFLMLLKQFSYFKPLHFPKA